MRIEKLNTGAAKQIQIFYQSNSDFLNLNEYCEIFLNGVKKFFLFRTYHTDNQTQTISIKYKCIIIFKYSLILLIKIINNNKNI